VSATLRAEAAAAGAEIDLLTTVHHHSEMLRGTLFSAQSSAGWRRFAVLPGALSPATCLAFFPRLLDDARRPVLLVVTDHPVYHATEVDAYVDSTKAACGRAPGLRPAWARPGGLTAGATPPPDAARALLAAQRWQQPNPSTYYRPRLSTGEAPAASQ